VQTKTLEGTKTRIKRNDILTNLGGKRI